MTRTRILAAALALGTVSVLGGHSSAVAQINITVGPPVPAAQVVAVPSTPAYFYDGRYYRYDNRTWSSGERHDGPWGPVAVEKVPQPVKKIPGAYKHGKFAKGGPHPFCPPGQAKKGRC